MRKFYFITATDGTVGGKQHVIRADHAFKNIKGGCAASNTHTQDIKTKYPDYFLSLGGSAVIFLRRANARDAVAKMNAQSIGSYTYSVREAGEFKRTVRPVLGYRLLLETTRGNYLPSTFNNGDVVVDHAAQFGGDLDANRLFRTRAEARVAKETRALNRSCIKYKIQTVYADA